jgi:multicomponent Na+:H+ antiporter subunit E
VARCILTNDIQPQTLRIKPKQKTDAGLAVHANSITLTPGTISVDYSSKQLLVHALTHHTAEGIKGDEMNIKVATLEGIKE